jgi:hypothetical protein
MIASMLCKMCAFKFRTPSGRTNFEDAFKLTFDVLDATTEGPNCHHSILFLTDGEQTDGAK